jgi:glutamate---cysteine ligase / carboxylate-amine ligase
VTGSRPLPAFAAYGIELEYAIVDAQSLDACPMARTLLEHPRMGHAGTRAAPALEWSNELVAHVVELKNAVPVPDLDVLARAFQTAIASCCRTLSTHRARLMPTGMHPWMNPRTEAVLWSGNEHLIYETYDRLFDCRRHGWANLQSMHINLPFADEAQFVRLHAAVRLVLPLLPALAASSPIAQADGTGWADFRLECYRNNALRFPAIAGSIIPESVDGFADYQQRVLAPMYAQIAPHDPDGILRHEWLNSRGAIARFDRSALEIRLADTQECPRMDLAIAEATIAVIRALYDRDCPPQAVATDSLARVFHDCVRYGEHAVVEDVGYIRALGIPGWRRTASQVWRALIDNAAVTSATTEWWHPYVRAILEQGTLARRILRAVHGEFTRDRLRQVYRRLCDCLTDGVAFELDVGEAGAGLREHTGTTRQ